MSWDSTWEQLFQSRDWGRYPPEELIRFVARNFFSAPVRKQVKILELGCGTGANLWFLAREGFDTYGIDGSRTAIHRAKQRLIDEKLTAQTQIGDIAALKEFYPSERFDAVIDVACLQHNKAQSIKAIVGQVVDLLKPGGKMFSMAIAAGSYGDGFGQQLEPGTFTEISEGPLQGKGLCHFSSLEELQQLYLSDFDVEIESSLRTLDNQQHAYKHWVVTGIKTANL